ncbi:hypothetical protein C4D60_Mb11t19350 [Musa balbisiana]|uniref:Uncharacterized protein n=1 Tax=Musa balbisiana TaxID=52838 RepID=A0A4S8J584_MUSBA|nr:hypothetical protein C4D60_Mb11t19350 [Musa balbisiana]
MDPARVTRTHLHILGETGGQIFDPQHQRHSRSRFQEIFLQCVI